jgi:hypothetical protein
MADNDPLRFKGASCTATLDLTAQTLTFEHSGFGAFAEQKALSPVVVPLGAISTVEFKRGRFSSWFYVTLRDQPPWLHGVSKDPHGLTCGVDPTPFAEAVQTAVGSVAPLEQGEWEPAEAPEVEDAPPSWRGRFAKSAASAVITGFFNTR